MHTIAFDGRMGASGDMLLGALVAAGANPDVLAPIEDALPIRYEFETVEKNGIASTRARVRHLSSVDSDDAGNEADADTDNEHDHEHSHDHHDHHDHDHEHSHDHHDHHDHDHEHSHDHHDHHDHDHEHDHEHSHDHHDHHDHDHHDHDHDHHDHHDHDHHDHDHDHHDHHDHEHSHDHHGHDAEGHGPQRTYAEVVDVVEEMDLSDTVRDDALAIFEILGEAEAAVHGSDLADTHFHEVGADDAIADVVGTCLLFDDLASDRIVTTPLSTGGGEVEFSHGVYPVPVPAVVEVAERATWSLRGGPVDAELLTPTGAAILAHVADGVERLPSLCVEQSGYGAGGWTFPDRPNVLRAVVGRAERGGLVRDDVAVLKTNLDDAAPELLGGLQETLADAGARDVTIVPTTMKKSRPGHLVTVICKPDDADRVARRLAEETGTLGVREEGATHRWIAQRDFETVELDVDGDTYEVSVKIASDTEGTVYDVSAEYDDAAAVARETHLPVRTVVRRAERVVHDRRAADEEATGSE